MKVVVLGAGVVGTAAAWYLARAGHEVIVVERQGAAGLETSLANGGQNSASHPETRGNPRGPPQLVERPRREGAPTPFSFPPPFPPSLSGPPSPPPPPPLRP